MKFLITGAAGFVGTNLARRLLELGEQVVAVDSLSRIGSERNLGFLRGAFPNIEFHQREIEEIPALVYLQKPDRLFHFAAQVAVTTSLQNPLRDFRINGEGTFAIAKAAHDIGIPVIYTSTNKVYGSNVNLVPIREEASRYDFDGDLRAKGIPESFSIDAPHHTPYGISKLVGELYVREFGGIANRCSCMYGPNQFGIVDQGWLSHFAINKISGRATTIFGDGKQVRDALHITDVVDLLLKQSDALTQSREQFAGEAFNVGGGFSNTISLLELCEVWGIEPVFQEWRQADQKVFYCDLSKAESSFDWRPRVPLNDGLKDLFDWTRSELGRQ